MYLKKKTNKYNISDITYLCTADIIYFDRFIKMLYLNACKFFIFNDA